MEVLHYQSGRLICEQVEVASIAERFGTPTYVYSQRAILGSFRRLQEELTGIPNLLCYSVKANFNLRILRLLREAGAGFDVVSGGELARALKVGADPSGVVFSGVGKTAAEVDAGLAAGILMFNVESAGELEVIEARARASGKQAGIAIRINPDVEAETHPYVSTGQHIHKFGVPKDESIELYRRAAASEHLRIRGVACHIGSQILDVEPYLKALDEVLGIASMLSGLGIAVEYLDLGGGFGIRYFDEAPLDFERLTKGVAARLHGTPYRLILEPGRSLVGAAGVLLARVLYVKRNPQKNFVVVDAGMNDLVRPALYGSYHQIIPVVVRPGETLRADVVGPLCETGDFLAQDRELSAVESGDLVAILTAGAYGYALASNYNSRLRPAEVLVHGAEVELIRRRETLDDLFATEML
ncbi:MAG TPA: diaminopimelate decarboxylase [Terriglobia bacterium]|nr:diaminopimelate decarboxylase [Terriglobia bacterium]